jgi:hypothetical protein
VQTHLMVQATPCDQSGRARCTATAAPHTKGSASTAAMRLPPGQGRSISAWIPAEPMKKLAAVGVGIATYTVASLIITLRGGPHSRDSPSVGPRSERRSLVGKSPSRSCERHIGPRDVGFHAGRGGNRHRRSNPLGVDATAPR